PVADQARFKQLGLERLLHYDPYPRKSLIDHFYAPEVKLDDVMALRAVEQGNFVSAGYDSDVRKASGRVELIERRAGQAAGTSLRLEKTIRLDADSDTLTIRYLLECLPHRHPLHFAVEFNFAGLAANQDDRYFYLDGRKKAGQLQTVLDDPSTKQIGLVDD